jgi:acetyl-CoA acetyltransferase
MSSAFIYEAVRTPFGRYGGGLAGVRPDDLAAHTLTALLERVPALDPASIDDVILGDANASGEDNRDVARMAVLLATASAARASRPRSRRTAPSSPATPSSSSPAVSSR